MAREKAAGSSVPTSGRASGKKQSTGKRRPAKEEDDASAGAEQTTKTEKKTRPVPCIRRHTDREFRRAFPEVFKGLVKKAKAGGVRETRLLLDIGQFGDAKAAKRRGAKSLSAMLLEELKQRQDEREAAMDGTAKHDAVAAAETGETRAT